MFFHRRNIIYILLIGPINYVIAGFRFFCPPPLPAPRTPTVRFSFHFSFFFLIVRRTTTIYNNIPVHAHAASSRDGSINILYIIFFPLSVACAHTQTCTHSHITIVIIRT